MKRLIRRKAYFVCLVAALLLTLPMAARAVDFTYQTINGSFTPGPFFWAGGNNLGWYWTPPTNVDLVGIQTQLTTGFYNINNNYTFTTGVYTTNGGTLLGSFTWNGATYLLDGWLGGSFASPLPLKGGTTYFLGFTGWSAAYGWNGPSSGAGVMMAATDSSGDTFLGEQFLDGWFGTSSWNNNFAAGSWPDGPILNFIATVPEPCTMLLLGPGLVGLVGLRWRRK